MASNKKKKSGAKKKALKIEARSIPLKDQVKRLWPVMLLCIFAGAAAIAGVLVISSLTGVIYSSLTRDVVSIVNAKPVVGIFSTIGIILLASATAIILFSSFLLGRRSGRSPERAFLFCSGLLSLLITLDDALVFHDGIFPQYLHISQLWIYSFYALVAAVYLWVFARRILKTDYLLFLIALAMLGLSVCMDVVLAQTNFETLIEDGVKFFGILFWLAYYARTSAKMLRDAYSEES